MAKAALLIGVGTYESGFNPLPAATRDVQAIKQVLQNPQIGGFDELNIRTLENPDPQRMREEIESLFADRQKDDLLLLYFSGHGVKDDSGSFYLTNFRTRKNRLNSTAISSDEIHRLMEASRSKYQVVILDCCFSGAFATGMTAKADGVNVSEQLNQLGGQGRAVLTSSSAVEYSFEQKELDLSLYTHYLVEGI
ncbi:MAG: caspase family protein, partial [Verrucomicrobia bacterium]|nr:caspase family protein [Leptolyngbya sp. ES-bin-22]